MDDIEKMLSATFLEEATQLLEDTEQSFLALESSPDDPRIIDGIFRLAHNLKGSANAVGFLDLGHFMHELESLFLNVRNKILKIDENVVDVFLRCNDLLTTWVARLKQDPLAHVDHSELLDRVRQLNVNRQPTDSHPIPSSGFTMFEEESAAPCRKQAVESVSETSSAPAFKDDSIRVNLHHVDDLVNDIGELVILQTVLKQQKHLVSSPLIQKTIDQLAKITRQIQESSMRLRMVPLHQTFQKMQRILRDTSKALHKDINLHVSGEGTGLDKTVLDNLGDPLVHLIRNAADHGVEMPEERMKKGKAPQGNGWLSAYHQGGKIVIEIKDDGGGLVPERLVARAKEKGLIAKDAVLSDEAACQLIFLPGFSTKNLVTDISGRGVGLDVVKTNIMQLKGEIQLENSPGQGTCFRILLPLTLAIIDGMIICLSENERYIIPIAQVHEIFEVKGPELHPMGLNAEVFDIRGKALPLFHLGNVLGRQTSPTKGRGVVIVSRFNQEEFAFSADRVLSQQQVVIKQLGRDLKKINGISGSAILGDGKAALILDLEEIAKGRSA